MKFADASRPVWIEVTRSEHEHGGSGWEFGTCLWSPARATNGADRYATMREVSVGDRILHFNHMTDTDLRTDTFLVGESKALSAVAETTNEPPKADVWSGRDSYYRIDLGNFREFPIPLALNTLIDDYGNEIRREIVESRPRNYPLATYGQTLRLVQGMYLARCTPNLLRILHDALGIEEADEQSQPDAAHREYAEGMRRAREAFYFARNPRLARDAKAAYGYTCQGCGFNFEERFGELGEGFIECHHLNPLSERSETEWSEEVASTLDNVAVLCSNCHRMVHRRRPALTLAELQSLVSVRNTTLGEPKPPHG